MFCLGLSLEKGVGQQRIPYYDKAWRVEEPNTFGTDEFITLCREVGAEPYICTNAGTGTPEEMADCGILQFDDRGMGELTKGKRSKRAFCSQVLEHWQ